MIYIDTSVALAELLSEKNRPHPSFWSSAMTSSRLLEYEIIVRLHARGSGPSLHRIARDLLTTVTLIDLDPPALERALKPFPVTVRTLDAVHLATMDFLRGRGLILELATYDRRLADGATAMGFALAPLTVPKRR